jgi:membrane-associated phospholipid phosphatase
VKKNITIGRISIPVSLIVGLLVLVASSLFNFVTSELIQYLYPDRPVVPDLLFDILPYVPWLQYVFDTILATSIILMLVYALKIDWKHSGYYFFVIGVSYFVRAILMALTPLGQPVGNNETMGIGLLLNIYQHGMFPSGHTCLAATIFLLMERARAPRMKIAAGIMLILEMVTLLLSHAHYSIDIVGALMVSYLIVLWLSRYKERFLVSLPVARTRRDRAPAKRAAAQRVSTGRKTRG